MYIVLGCIEKCGLETLQKFILLMITSNFYECIALPQFYIFYSRFYFSGDKQGAVEIFSENLPCLPDNVSPSLSGGYWVGCILVRSFIPDFFSTYFVSLRSFLSKVCS